MLELKSVNNVTSHDVFECHFSTVLHYQGLFVCLQPCCCWYIAVIHPFLSFLPSWWWSWAMWGGKVLFLLLFTLFVSQGHNGCHLTTLSKFMYVPSWGGGEKRSNYASISRRRWETVVKTPDEVIRGRCFTCLLPRSWNHPNLQVNRSPDTTPCRTPVNTHIESQDDEKSRCLKNGWGSNRLDNHLYPVSLIAQYMYSAPRLNGHPFCQHFLAVKAGWPFNRKSPMGHVYQWKTYLLV